MKSKASVVVAAAAAALPPAGRAYSTYHIDVSTVACARAAGGSLLLLLLQSAEACGHTFLPSFQLSSPKGWTNDKAGRLGERLREKEEGGKGEGGGASLTITPATMVNPS